MLASARSDRVNSKGASVVISTDQEDEAVWIARVTGEGGPDPRLWIHVVGCEPVPFQVDDLYDRNPLLGLEKLDHDSVPRDVHPRRHVVGLSWVDGKAPQ